MSGAMHRKRVKHFDEAGHVHELTFSTYKRQPVLLQRGVAELVLASLKAATDRGLLDVIAFVVMPEHVHVLVLPSEHVDEEASPVHKPPVAPEAGVVPVARILRAVKRPSSFRVKRLWECDRPELVEWFTLLERPGKASFRLWQQGGGYDRNITRCETLRNAIEYIHLNPVRRGLCARPVDWAWSSARQWRDGSLGLDEWMPRVRRNVL